MINGSNTIGSQRLAAIGFFISCKPGTTITRAKLELKVAREVHFRQKGTEECNKYGEIYVTYGDLGKIWKSVRNDAEELGLKVVKANKTTLAIQKPLDWKLNQTGN